MKKALRMTGIIRRALCSEGKGKGASTETVYAIYRRAVCPPDVGERSAAAAAAVVTAAATAAAATAATAAIAAAAAAATAAEQDDDQNDDPQTITAPTIITTHKHSLLKSFVPPGSTGLHFILCCGAKRVQAEKRNVQRDQRRWTFLYAVTYPESGWRSDS